MDLSPWNYWTDRGTKPRPDTRTMVSTLEKTIARYPNHPGACHFYIHAIEASTTPENSCPRIAPVLRPPSRVCVVVYHCSSVGVTPAAWTRIRTSPRPGWGTGAVPAIRAGESRESLKRATFIAFVVSYSALEWLSRE